MLRKSGGKQRRIRPFVSRYKMTTKSYSRKLSRIVTDFGADLSFEKTATKIKEHYNVCVPVPSVRVIVEKSARRALQMVREGR